MKVLNKEGSEVAMRDQICYETHDTPIAGHLGRDRMYALISRSFFWPRMLKDIVKQVSECAECQHNKTVKGKRQGLYTPVIPSIRRWSEWSLDWIFKLPKTQGEGYDGIFVVMDSTTKRVHLFPFKETWGAKETADLIFKRVFPLHGLPEKIYSDRDTRFTSKLWQHLWKSLGTKLAMTTPYHPQGNSPNERVHAVIEEMLRHVTQYPPQDWDTHLPVIEFAINNAENRQTGYTPFYLDTHQHPLDPLTLFARIKESEFAPENSDVQTIIQDHDEVLRKAYTTYIEAQRREAERQNENRRQPVFKVGDTVRLMTKHLNWPGVDLLGKVFKPKYVGPFTVKWINKNKTVVRLEWSDPSVKIHPVQPISRIELLRKDTRPTRSGEMYLEPEIRDGDEYFQIDKLVARRPLRRQGRIIGYSYLVKWLSYPSSHNLWMPEAHLRENDAGDLIDDYDREHPR